MYEYCRGMAIEARDASGLVSCRNISRGRADRSTISTSMFLPVDDGTWCALFHPVLADCISCCQYTTAAGGQATNLACANSCLRAEENRRTQPPVEPTFFPPAWNKEFSCVDLVLQITYTDAGQITDRNDKFQHCYTSCRLSQVCNRPISGLLGTIREHAGYDPRDSQHDMNANAAGIYCAGHSCPSSGYRQPNRQCCYGCCAKTYKPSGVRQAY